MKVGPTALRGRQPRTTYLYEDPVDPTRVTGALGEPWFTGDDRSLLLGLAAFENTLCPGVCRQPKHLAWHAIAQASWEGDEIVCHACTAIQGHQVAYAQISTSMTEADIEGLPPFVWGETTTRADPPSQR